jgi:hypothetical protein
MLGALIVVFREVMEAGIIVGILLAVTKGVPGRGRWVAAGVGAGVAVAALLAVFADRMSNALVGIGQELFNASVLAIAVVMLVWHNIWMARHGRQLAAQMKEVGEEVAKGSRPLAAVAIVVAVAVLREGSEIVLFLWFGDRGRLVHLGPRGGRTHRSLAWLRGYRSDLFRLGQDSWPVSVRRNNVSLSRGWTCRSERRFSSAGGRRNHFGRDGLGYVRDFVG